MLNRRQKEREETLVLRISFYGSITLWLQKAGILSRTSIFISHCKYPSNVPFSNSDYQMNDGSTPLLEAEIQPAPQQNFWKSSVHTSPVQERFSGGLGGCWWGVEGGTMQIKFASVIMQPTRPILPLHQAQAVP